MRHLSISTRLGTRPQEQARKTRDFIKLNCLVDKLVLAKANVSISDGVATAMQEAVSKKDDDTIRHEFTRMTIVYQRAKVVGSESEGCTGGDDLSDLSSKVEVTIDPTISDSDGSDVVFSRPIPERPPAASPYK